MASIRNKMLAQADLWPVPVQLRWWSRRDEGAVGSEQPQSVPFSLHCLQVQVLSLPKVALPAWW